MNAKRKEGDEQLPGGVCVQYSQILQMRKAEEGVLVYGFQVVGCKEAVERGVWLIFYYLGSERGG